MYHVNGGMWKSITVAETSGGWWHSGQDNSNGWQCTVPQAAFRGQARLSSEGGGSKPTLHPMFGRGYLERESLEHFIWDSPQRAKYFVVPSNGSEH